MCAKSSIDPEEINKFNKTNEQWWDLDGEFKMLHKINPVRTEYIKSKICQHFQRDESLARPLVNLNILDVGSGGGLVCKSIHEMRAQITGLDANIHNVQAASHHAKQNNLNINYIHSTVEEHCLKNRQKYDVVLGLEVIEHVANPRMFLQNIGNLAKPDGLLIFSTLNRTIKSYMLAIIMAEYVLSWVPKKTHQYEKFVKPSEFVSMLGDTNWQLSELKGLEFSLINNNWHLSENIDVNYFSIFKGK